MLVSIKEAENQRKGKENEMPIEVKRATNDLLRVSSKGMMSWAEKNHKQKLIDILYKMGYYKYNQTIFLTSPTKEI